VRSLAYDAMHNQWDELSERQSPAARVPRSIASSSSDYPPGGTRRSPRAYSMHVLMKITDVPGWKGSSRARCSVCRDSSSQTACVARRARARALSSPSTSRRRAMEVPRAGVTALQSTSGICTRWIFPGPPATIAQCRTWGARGGTRGHGSSSSSCCCTTALSAMMNLDI
jgi:hypothetical protein